MSGAQGYRHGREAKADHGRIPIAGIAPEVDVDLDDALIEERTLPNLQAPPSRLQIQTFRFRSWDIENPFQKMRAEAVFVEIAPTGSDGHVLRVKLNQFGKRSGNYLPFRLRDRKSAELQLLKL